MTAFLVFTLGAVIGGILAIAASYNHLVGLIQDQDAKIFRLRETQATLVAGQATLAATLRLGTAPAFPVVIHGWSVELDIADAPDSITCDNGGR